MSKRDGRILAWEIDFIFILLCARAAEGTWESSVKTSFSLKTKFWRHCVLNVRTKRRAFPRYQSEEMAIFSFFFLSSNQIRSYLVYLVLNMYLLEVQDGHWFIIKY